MAKKLFSTVLMMLTITVLGGCGAVPIVSDAKRWGHESLDEQQEWGRGEALAAIEVLGQPDGWWAWDSSFQWSNDQELIVRSADTESCRPNSGGDQPGRFSLDLNNNNFGDPREAAERLRAHWIAHGWVVSNINEPQDAVDSTIEFRADRDDGAMVAFMGNEIFVNLGFYSSCSDNATVTMRY